MGAIIATFVLAFIINLVVLEGVVLGIVWLVNNLIGFTVSYGLVGVVVAVLLLLIFFVQSLFVYDTYKKCGNLKVKRRSK